MNKKSIKNRLFLLMTLIGVIPFTAAMLFIAWQNSLHLEQRSKTNLWNRNVAINENLTQIFDKNFYVLRTLAYAPRVRNYVISPSPQEEEDLTKILKQTNELFHDENQIILTSSNGIQILRTDHAPKVHIAQRKHFQEAMAGREYISDVMISTSTGGAVVVLETPIFDQQSKPIGLAHRNYYLDAVQNLIQAQHTEDTTILILDRDNNIIAFSDSSDTYSKGMNVTEGIQQLMNTMSANEKTVRMNIRGTDWMVSFSRNVSSGWGIVTMMPYSQIWSSVGIVILRGFILGAILFLLVATAAYFMADRLTRPIREIAQLVSGLASGRHNIDSLSGLSDDELGQIAQAVNEMRHVHGNVKETAQFDPLTGLHNLASAEAVCRQKLQEYQETTLYAGLVAIILVDLDNFKKANAESGHQYGNQILKEFANLLKNVFTANDCVGRIEGDEFIVILDHQPDTEAIRQKAERVNQAAREIMINGSNAGLTASIGIAIAPRNGKSYNHLFHAADLALFAAKEHGRNQYRLADENE